MTKAELIEGLSNKLPLPKADAERAINIVLDDIIAALVKYTSTTQQIAAATYDLYMRQQVIAHEAALSEEGIKANFDALVALGDLTERPPLADFIDGSFLAEASRP